MDLQVSVDQLDVAAGTGDADNIAVVKVVGEVDVASVESLDSELKAVAAAGSHHIIVDLSAVDFIDSTGLGVIVKALKEARDNQGWLRVVAQSDRVTKIFSITGLDSEVGLSQSIQQAAGL